MPALQVVEQDQPYGEQGTRFSLEEVARRAAKGGLDARVRAWAIECLERARIEQGIPCDNDRQRTEVLLKAVQKKLWVPDPVGAEWMAGAHLLACDRSSQETICMHGSDCDDLSLLLGACLLGVGIYVAVVGHAYGASRSISHVLLAAWVDGQWEYADPSTTLPLGTCVKFTRERMLSVPNVKVICDQNVCLTDKKAYHPEQNNFVAKGIFVGVDGPPIHAPIFAWTVPMSVLAGPTAQGAAYDAAYEELEKDPDPTSERALKTAGSAAAAAACAAVGAAAASPLCAAAGSAIVGEVVKFVNGIGAAGVPYNQPPQTEGWYLALLHNQLFKSEPAWTMQDGVRELQRSSGGAIEPGGVRVFGALKPWPAIGDSAGNRQFSQIVAPTYKKAEAGLIAQRAAELVGSTAGTKPIVMTKTKKSSPLIPLALAGVVAGGLWWATKS